MEKLVGLTPNEIYDKTIDTISEQIRIADAHFSARLMDSWLLEVERILKSTKKDLMVRTINEAGP